MFVQFKFAFKCVEVSTILVKTLLEKNFQTGFNNNNKCRKDTYNFFYSYSCIKNIIPYFFKLSYFLMLI